MSLGYIKNVFSAQFGSVLRFMSIKKLFYLMEGSEHPLEVKVALSVPEALEIISEHEIGKTVRFSVYTSTKDFGSTGKS